MSCIITYKGQKYLEEEFKEYFINNKQEFATSIAKNKNVTDSFKKKMEGIDYVFSQSAELASIGSKAQYLQYLSTIFKTSKVRDIVYHGTDKNFDKFQKEFIGDKTGWAKDLPGFYFFGNRNSANTYTIDKNDGARAVQFERMSEGYDISELKDKFPDVNEAFKKSGEEYFIEFGIGYLRDKVQQGNLIQSIISVKNPAIYDAKGARLVQRISEIKNTLQSDNDGVIIENTLDQLNDSIGFEDTTYVVNEPEQIHILGSKQDIEGFKQFLKKDDESIYYKNLEDEIKVLEEDKIKIAEKRRNFREWINRFTTLNEVKNDNQKLLESRRQVFKDLGFTETYDNTFELKTSSYVTLISKKQALDDNPLIRFDGKLTGVKYTQKSVDGTYILTYKLDDITKTSIREAQIKGEMPFTKSDLKETLKSEDFLNSVSENIFDGLSPEETQIIKEKLESGEYNINCKL